MAASAIRLPMRQNSPRIAGRTLADPTPPATLLFMGRRTLSLKQRRRDGAFHVISPSIQVQREKKFCIFLSNHSTIHIALPIMITTESLGFD